MVEETFVTRLAKYGRVTIPQCVRDILGVETGDYIRITVAEIIKKKSEESDGTS